MISVSAANVFANVFAKEVFAEVKRYITYGPFHRLATTWVHRTNKQIVNNYDIHIYINIYMHIYIYILEF